MDERQGQGAPGTSGFFNRPVIVSLLYLATYFTGFSLIVGIILAHIWRSEAREEWEISHLRYLIRTFWITAAVVAGAAVLMIAYLIAVASNGPNDAHAGEALLASFAAAMIVAAIALVWMAVRSLVSLVKAGTREPIARPETWLF